MEAAYSQYNMMLKMYEINNKNLKKFYDDLSKTDPKEHKNLKETFNLELVEV